MEEPFYSKNPVLSCVLHQKATLTESHSWMWRAGRKGRSYNIVTFSISPLLVNARVDEKGNRFIREEHEVEVEGYETPGILSLDYKVERTGAAIDLKNCSVHHKCPENGPFSIKYKDEWLLIQVPEFEMKHLKYNEQRETICPFYQVDLEALESESDIFKCFVELIQGIRKRCVEQLEDQSGAELMLSKKPSLRIHQLGGSAWLESDTRVDFEDIKRYKHKVCDMIIFPVHWRDKYISFRIWKTHLKCAPLPTQEPEPTWSKAKMASDPRIRLIKGTFLIISQSQPLKT